MYPYHNRIKQRIRAGELTGYHLDNNYPRIGLALVLEFSTYPFFRPIRQERCEEYADILEEWRRGHDVERGKGAEVIDSARPA